MNQLTPGLAALAASQHGMLTLGQMYSSGFTEAAVRRLLRSGVLVSKGRRVVASALAPASAFTDLVALMLDIGGKVWASHTTAAALLGCDGFTLAPSFHVTIERGRHVDRPGHVVHTSDEMRAIDRRSTMRCSRWRSTRWCATSSPPRITCTGVSPRFGDGVATASRGCCG